MAEDPSHQLLWTFADVVDNHRDGRPSTLGQSGGFHTVVFPPVGVGVPFKAVVLGHDVGIGPGEVHPPYAAVEVDDCVLQFGQWQTAVNKYQARFGFHWRFGACVHKLHKFADLDYAATSLLLVNRRDQLRARTASRMERGVEYRKCTRSTKRPCDLYSGPCGCRQEPATETFQRRTKSLMDHHFGGRSHTNARVENVQTVIGFGIEPVQFGGGPHACNHSDVTSHVERGKSGV